MMNGAASPACFFARLAAFFSFGVSMACFLVSLLDRWDLDIVFTPVDDEGTLGDRAVRGSMASALPFAPSCAPYSTIQLPQ